MKGWSVNLTSPGHDFELELPVPALFETSVGSVVELVFWSAVAERWVHAVSEHFARELPGGHVQVTLGDMTWLRRIVDRAGVMGLRVCVAELEESQIPDG